MSEFLSLNPSGLPEDFDVEVFGEKPIVSVDERQDRIEINYVFPGFTIGDVEQQVDDESLPFKEVGISGVGFISESGKPLLPSFGRYVQIPPGCDYKVSSRKSRPVSFDDVLITPAQELATDREDVPHEFEYSEEAYAQDALYPTNVVEVSEPQNLDDYRVLAIQVRPLQYNPAKQRLSGHSNITVTIKLSVKEADEEVDVEEFPMLDPSVNREGFGNLVLNPSRSIARRIPIVPIPVPIIINPGPEFLIIYDNKLKNAADQLAAWKNRKGLITEAVSIDVVGNSVAQIKEYIRKRRRIFRARLRYVLLLGDVVAIRSEERAGNTTDHYYFTKNDPANNSDCLLPWISGGRMPVNSLDEANAVIGQVINYERTPPCDAHYYRRMTFAAYFQDNPPMDGRADRAYVKTLESIREHLVSLGLAVQRVYVSNNPNPQKYKDGTNVPADVRNAIVSGADATDMLISETSEGQLLIGHRDHGSTQGWAHPSFQNQHLNAILSAAPSIFYSINCLTGRFDANPHDSFAEALLELVGGAPSLIAATELSGTWRNDSLMKALFDAVWPGVISGFPGTTASYPVKYNRLGDILNYAKSYLLLAHGSTSGVKGHFEIYHVVGDPTLEIWARQPATLQLSASIQGNKLNIHICPAATGGVVTIWYLGRLVKRIAVSSTLISIPISDLRLTPSPVPLPFRFIVICAAAPGYRFCQTRVRL